MKKFEIRWTEMVGYVAEIEAETEEEARQAFFNGEVTSMEPCGFCETETDSVEVTELDDKE